jgi:hypothetical protein
VFLERVRKERIALGTTSTVIVEELSQVGRGDMLQLLKLQQTHGFRMLAIGDPRQGGSIDPEVIDLLITTLGDQVPRILTSVRQNTDREREISRLFRDGKAGEAITMKLEDRTAELVAGGRSATVQRIAAKWLELAEADPTLQPTIGTATNRDAHDIGMAIRRRLQDAGAIGPDKLELGVMRRDAAGNRAREGRIHPMALAEGDKVRVFNRIWANGHFASNGDVLELTAVSAKGMTARNEDGHDAFVEWRQLQGRFDPAPRLAYGHALTIDASQGTTSRVHIDAVLSGSWQQQGGKGYVNESRQVETTHLIVNEAAERKRIYSRIPRGEYRPVQAADIWKHVADNLSRPTTKASALAFLRVGSAIYRGGIAALPATLEPAERREKAGEARMSLRTRMERIGAEMSRAIAERARELPRRAANAVQRANDIWRSNRVEPERRPEPPTRRWDIER